MQAVISIQQLSKTYASGHPALQDINLDIRQGEIFALLGPNGAGKTTLIGAVCGLVRPTGGTIHAFGHDLSRDWRSARARIGLVPQELATDMFETVWRAIAYSQGLFGKPYDAKRLEEILRSLSLWDKKDAQIRALFDFIQRLSQLTVHIGRKAVELVGTVQGNACYAIFQLKLNTLVSHLATLL